MKIISWNVNGVRACYQKGLTAYLDREQADVVCLQEIKAEEDQFPEELINRPEYFYINPAQKKGYSGVALICKKDPLNVWEGLGPEEFDSEGRVLIAEFDDFFLFNCYFPNGQRDLNRVPYKLAFSDKVMEEALRLKKQMNKEVVICGDYNTAHKEIDLANPKTNTNTTGFLPNERAWIDKFISRGFVDAFRVFTPEDNGHYTWWTYRGDCRERNIGWRIDYFFVTNNLKNKIKRCIHQPEVLGSDHCPIVLEIK
jgi:exodeoxyribonuclease III